MWNFSVQTWFMYHIWYVCWVDFAWIKFWWKFGQFVKVGIFPEIGQKKPTGAHRAIWRTHDASGEHKAFWNANGPPNAHMVCSTRIWHVQRALGVRAAAPGENAAQRAWRASGARVASGEHAGYPDAAANAQICQVRPISPGIKFSPHEKIFTHAKCL